MFLSPPPSLYVHHLETAFLALSALTLLIALFPLLTTTDRKAAPDKKKRRMKSLDKIRSLVAHHGSPTFHTRLLFTRLTHVTDHSTVSRLLTAPGSGGWDKAGAYGHFEPLFGDSVFKKGEGWRERRIEVTRHIFPKPSTTTLPSLLSTLIPFHIALLPP
eukprot:CAMPEP_0197557370 /NCGR_PEP_ID=MMETSP1320-20131121/16978_1 /TAXON_ID=91990 /ORGANISM="Bolidomonas sp., Strain RCC2347" /LENGTH=159 /DNA_ID=CAMNT_0043118595 /DNA_START=96 /DNA_END=572 /DNA_ORIENTATION=-